MLSAAVTPNTVLSAAVTPETVLSAAVTPETVLSAAVTPETVLYAAVTPETVLSAVVTPETVLSAAVTPETVLSAAVTPETVLSAAVTPETVLSAVDVSDTAVPEMFASAIDVSYATVVSEEAVSVASGSVEPATNESTAVVLSPAISPVVIFPIVDPLIVASVDVPEVLEADSLKVDWNCVEGCLCVFGASVQAVEERLEGVDWSVGDTWPVVKVVPKGVVVKGKVDWTRGVFVCTLVLVADALEGDAEIVG